VIWGRRVMLDRAIEFGENRIIDRLQTVLDMSRELAMQLLYQRNLPLAAASSVHSETRQMVAEVLRPEMVVLLQEINKTLIYMASRTRGKSVDTVHLAGRVALYPGVVSSLREQLNLPVDILNPIAEFASEKTRIDTENLGVTAGMALTTGLALRGIAEGD
jgi:type IV pilus assembly protein PilM